MKQTISVCMMPTLKVLCLIDVYKRQSYGNMLGKYHYAYTTGSIANKLIPTIRGEFFICIFEC